MKRRILEKLGIFILILCFAQVAQAQVTIGSGIKPNQGAILDIKQYDDDDSKNGGRTAKKGLGLPRVALVAVDQLEPCTVTNTTNKASHTSLTVYNITDNSATIATLKEGVYTWDGETWQPMGLKGAQGFGPWYQVDNPTLPSREVDTDSYLKGKAVVGGGSPIGDAQLSVYGNTTVGTVTEKKDLRVNGNLYVSNTPILGSSTAVVVDTEGRIGTAAVTVPSKFMFLQSKNKYVIEGTTLDDLNTYKYLLVPWTSADIISNNLLIFNETENVFVMKENALVELSGYVNYAPNADVTQKFVTLNAIIQVKQGASTTWTQVAAGRSIWICNDTGSSTGYSAAITVNIPPAMLILDAGDQVRMVIQQNYGGRHGGGAPNSMPYIINPNGTQFTRGMKVLVL